MTIPELDDRLHQCFPGGIPFRIRCPYTLYLDGDISIEEFVSNFYIAVKKNASRWRPSTVIEAAGILEDLESSWLDRTLPRRCFVRHGISSEIPF